MFISKHRFCLMIIIIILLFTGVSCSKGQPGEIIIVGPYSEELVTVVSFAAMEKTGMNYEVSLHYSNNTVETRLMPYPRPDDRTAYIFGGNGYSQEREEE